MRLVENYLVQASQLLPAGVREDVLAELRASLEEQVLDRANAEGRAPEVEDEKAVLRNFGHPVKFAGSYLPQQYLIGPTLFPAYLYALKVVLIVVLAIHLALVLAVHDWGYTGFAFFFHLADTAVTIVVIVTLVFVALEYSGEKLNWYENWQPDAVDHGISLPANSSDLITNLITEGVLLLWWNNALQFPNWLEFASTNLSLSQAWAPLYWPLNVVVGSFFLLHAYLIVRGNWRAWTLALEWLLNAAFLGLIATALRGSSLVELSPGTNAGLAEAIQLWAVIVLWVFIAVTVWELGKCTWLAVKLQKLSAGK